MHPRARSTLRLMLAAAGLVMAVAACIETTKAPGATPYAYFIINVDPAGASYTVKPVAQVFSSQALALPNGHAKADSCLIYLYGTATDAPLDFISGGDSLAFTADGVTRYLKPTTVTSIVRYSLPSSTVPLATPGGRFTVTTPGGSATYPAGTLSSNTPPALTVQRPVTNADGTITLTWNAGDDSSRVGIGLVYASASAGFDRQIFCALTDDGTYTLPSTITAGYLASTQKRVEASRWRSALAHLTNAELFAYSSFNITPFTP
ncbi:MAG: hypothetical protein ABJD07_06350 [Gemmatimonadaceae bacterium]